MDFSKRAGWFMTGFAIALSSVTAAVADQTQEIDINSQNLAAALAELGRETALQVTAPQALVNGKQSAEVRGQMTPEDALGELLKGTSLTYVSLGKDGAVLRDDVQFAGTVSQNTIESPLDLGTLVLTGERVERDVFSTASSVRAYGDEELEANPQNNDVERVVTDAANITWPGPSNQTPFIRGQSFGGPAAGAQAAITGQLNRANVTIDGRIQTFNELAFSSTSVWDVEVIEVFRGPQTTSQGANAIAGAINIRTKDPVFEQQYAARVEGSSFDGFGVSFMTNQPLSDSVALRFTYDRQEQDGYINFPRGNGNPRARREEQETARLKLLWEPTAVPGLSNKLTLEYARFNRPQTQNVAIEDGSGNFVGLDFDNLVSNNLNGFPSAFFGETVSIIHDAEYAFDNGLTLRNQFIYSDHESTRTTNNPAEEDFPGESETVSTEFIVDYAPEGSPFSGIFGIFLSENTTSLPPGSVVNGFPAVFDGTIKNTGIFAEGTYFFGNGFDVTGAVRYELNDQRRIIEAPGFGITSLFGTNLNFDETFDAVLPSLTIGYQPNDNLRFALRASQGFNPGGVSASFGAIFGLITLPPGVSPFFTFEEETVDSIELSMRGRFLDDRLFVSANVFYNEFDNYQFSILQLLPSGDFDAIIGNAEGVESYGLEIDAQFAATSRLRVTGALGLLETKVTEFNAVPAALGSVVGNEQPYAPNVTASIGLDFDVTERLTLGGQIRYSGRYFTDIQNTPGGRVPELTTLDLRGTYSISDQAEVYGYVNNVTDEIEPITLGVTGTQGATSKPREFGIGVRATW